jgi:ammonium transporter, Amt family
MKSLGFNRLAGLAFAAMVAVGPMTPAAFAQEAPPAAAEAAPAVAPGGVAAPVAETAAATAEAPAAEAAPAPAPEKGDTTWMLLSTILVLLMILPGLALFYGGLVRQKNMLSMLMQVSTVTVIGMIAWVLWGYSLAFTDGGGLDKFIGGAGRLFLKDVTPASNVATFSTGVVIPELVFICFQMTFACITAALVLGGVAERMKFAACVVFAVLWPILSYYPMAHMVWWWAGPDAVAAAPTDPIQSGLLWGFGALDFAGGTVVHINAGIAALVGALILGPRKGYRSEAMPPHSLTLTLVGRRPAVGRLVRLQRRLQPRSQRLRGAGDDQHLHRHRRGWPVLGGRGMDHA